MIDLLDLFIRIMLVGIVLIAVMNVMIMSVYERVREIGTIAAIGTPLKMWVDQQTRTPAKIEAYAATGLLIKTLEYSRITDFGDGIVRPAMLETTSPLQRGYRSVMLFSGIARRDFPDEVFSLSYLPRIGDLRR